MKLVHVLVGLTLAVALGLSIGSYQTARAQLSVLEEYSSSQQAIAKAMQQANDQLQGLQAQCRVLEERGIAMNIALDALASRVQTLESAQASRAEAADNVIAHRDAQEPIPGILGNGTATFVVRDVQYALTLFDSSGGVLKLSEEQKELFDELVETVELQRAIKDQYVQECLARGEYKVVTQEEASTIAQERGGKLHVEQREDGVLIVELDDSLLQSQRDIAKDINRMRRALGATALECKGSVLEPR